MTDYTKFTVDDITICIVSFLRFDRLKLCICSIRRYYPNLKIIVVDNSDERVYTDSNFIWCINAPNVNLYKVDFDSGISFCRNFSVDRIRTRLAFLCDDDTIFTKHSRLEKLVDVLNFVEENSMVCGVSYSHGKPMHSWMGDLKYDAENNSIYHTPLNLDSGRITDSGTRFFKSRWYNNFMLARVSFFKKNSWNPKYKVVGDHLSHLMKIYHNNDNVYIVPSVPFINFTGSDSSEYKKYRWRKKEVSDKEIASSLGYNEILTPNKQFFPIIVEPDTSIEERKNLVILNIMKSGSTFVSTALSYLGFNHGTVNEYFESPKVDEINKSIIRYWKNKPINFGYNFFDFPINEEVNKWTEPWLIKDPKFAYTAPFWLKHWSKFQPTLIYVRRDLHSAYEIMLKRGWITRDKFHEIQDWYDKVLEVYDRWPWDKFIVDWEELFDYFFKYTTNQ